MHGLLRESHTSACEESEVSEERVTVMARQNGTNGTESLSGTVEATNDKGIKVGGQLFNDSQYADVSRPQRGQTVQLQVKCRFINSLAVLDSPNGSQRPAAGRETAITRLAVLKAAAEFLAPRSAARSADVLRVAERWEAWVTR